jgi:Mrp family chromosome partitioning ATPase
MALTRSQEHRTSSPPVATRADAGKLLTERADGEFVESFRVLALTTRRILDADKSKVLLVMSALPGDGRSTVAANLAIAMGEHHRVLLVDFRPESRGEAGWLEGAILNGGNGRSGVNGSPKGKAGLTDASESMPGPLLSTPHPHVWFMDPAEGVLRSGSLSETIRAAGENGLYTIIDSPAALESSETYRLAEQVGKVLYVVRTTPQRKEDHERVREVLARLNADVIGLVVNEH